MCNKILAEDTGFEPVEPFSQLYCLANNLIKPLWQSSEFKMVETVGLEPTTPVLSGQNSNQLN